MIYSCTIDTPLGKMRAAAEEESLRGLWFIDQKYFPAQTQAWREEPAYPVFENLRFWLAAYFSGAKPALDTSALSLNPQGTPFQQAIWQLLSKIPYGQTTSYGLLAKEYAQAKGLSSMSAQAVGGAVGRNPISLIIPCHRVIGAAGQLTGYAGGLEKKQHLLKLEGVDFAL